MQPIQAVHREHRGSIQAVLRQ